LQICGNDFLHSRIWQPCSLGRPSSVDFLIVCSSCHCLVIPCFIPLAWGDRTRRLAFVFGPQPLTVSPIISTRGCAEIPPSIHLFLCFPELELSVNRQITPFYLGFDLHFQPMPHKSICEALIFEIHSANVICNSQMISQTI
jgi:hypothetical protein